MAINFKNVGVIKEPGRSFQERQRSTVPIGIKTPVELDTSSGAFLAMHTSMRAQIADNLKNLISTNWGERVGLYNFGGNLSELATEFTNLDDFENEAAIRINTAIQRWMPFVEPLDMTSRIDNEDDLTGMAKIVISLVYAIPMLNVTKDTVEITIIAI